MNAIRWFVAIVLSICFSSLFPVLGVQALIASPDKVTLETKNFSVLLGEYLEKETLKFQFREVFLDENSKISSIGNIIPVTFTYTFDEIEANTLQVNFDLAQNQFSQSTLLLEISTKLNDSGVSVGSSIGIPVLVKEQVLGLNKEEKYTVEINQTFYDSLFNKEISMVLRNLDSNNSWININGIIEQKDVLGNTFSSDINNQFLNNNLEILFTPFSWITPVMEIKVQTIGNDFDQIQVFTKSLYNLNYLYAGLTLIVVISTALALRKFHTSHLSKVRKPGSSH